MVPKHHFAIHLPEQVAIYGALTDCFVVERSHLLPRSVANDIDNTITFETSTIQRVLLARMASLESFDERPGLTDKNAAICPELAAALGADAVLAAEGDFDGIEIRSDDVLLVDGHTLSLSAVCKSGDRYLFLGHVFAVVRSLSSSSGVWRKEDGLHMLEWSGQRVRRCQAWSRRGDGTWLLLQPVLR